MSFKSKKMLSNRQSSNLAKVPWQNVDVICPPKEIFTSSYCVSSKGQCHLFSSQYRTSMASMNPGSSHPNKASKYRGATFLNGEQQPLQKPFIENLFSFTEEDTVSKVQFLSKNEFWRNFAYHLFWIFAPNIVHIISWKFIFGPKLKVWNSVRRWAASLPF